LEGDIHTTMLNACDPWVESRSTMKNCFYAFVFGAGYYRLGITAGYPVDKAQKAGYNISEGIKWALPALADLNERVQRSAQRGYLIGLDGRKVWMRKDSNGKLLIHKSLNTLIQSAGSIIVKASTCWAHDQFKKKNIDAHMVIYMHDEMQIDAKEEDAEQTATILENSFKWTAKFFNFRVPLEGEAIIGDNWSMTH
jgi:DNA polymerase I-like protein with 3'-5' exonuclease and polymerase domains